MASALDSLMQATELRKKLSFTLAMFIVFRAGTQIPVPGVNAAMIEQLFNNGNLFGLLDLFSGGALSKFSIFAMSITPYINASIITQLLTVVIPTLEEWSKEGAEGAKKINKINRYAAVVLGVIQAIGMAYGLRVAVNNPTFFSYLTIVVSLTAGTILLMWIGEQITARGIGNGISLIIFAGIISRLPSGMAVMYRYLQAGTINIFNLLIFAVLAVLMVMFVVAITVAYRKIPVQYAKRVVGRKMYGGQSSHIPLKVNMTGVMPIIFAQAIASLPATIAAFAGVSKNDPGFWGGFLRVFDTTSIFYIVVYFLLIVGFSFFYSTMQFNPVEVANNLKKNGGFIPGFRPGKPTADFIHKVLNKITMFGALYLAIIAIAPIVTGAVIGVSSLAIGGTSIIIVVGVALETTKALEAQMLMRHYKGFLE